ncbi:MAG: hypothetical protein JOZ15_14480 [Acidobacteria bacterium]|nr:hypothetical protein [Acidobacteriota bacterium]
MILRQRFESILVLAISAAALGLTAAAVLTSQPEPADPLTGAATAATAMTAATKPQAQRSIGPPGRLAAPASCPLHRHNSIAVPPGARCAARRWPSAGKAPLPQLRSPACSAGGPAAADHAG